MEKKNSSKLFEGSQLFIEQAKEPGDTNWNNIEYSAKEKFIRRTITLTLTLGFLAASFWSIFAIGNEQGNLRREQTDSKRLEILAAISSILTVVINLVL